MSSRFDHNGPVNEDTDSYDEYPSIDSDYSDDDEAIFESLKMNKDKQAPGNKRMYIPNENKPKKSEEQIRYEFMRLFQDGNATKPYPFAWEK